MNDIRAFLGVRCASAIVVFCGAVATGLTGVAAALSVAVFDHAPPAAVQGEAEEEWFLRDFEAAQVHVLRVFEAERSRPAASFAELYHRLAVRLAVLGGAAGAFEDVHPGADAVAYDRAYVALMLRFNNARWTDSLASIEQRRALAGLQTMRTLAHMLLRPSEHRAWDPQSAASFFAPYPSTDIESFVFADPGRERLAIECLPALVQADLNVRYAYLIRCPNLWTFKR